MYARLITFRPKPEITADEARAVHEELIKVLEPIDGFVGCSLLYNEETRRGISMIIWRDAEAAEQSGEASLPVLLERVSGLLESAPEVSGYEMLDYRMQDA